MKSIATALFVLLTVAASGCKSKNGATGPDGNKPEPKFFNCPTIIIKSTQGDMRVVLFHSQPTTQHFIHFIENAEKGYYNGCKIQFKHKPRGINEYVVLRNTSDAGGEMLQTMRLANFHPVRGTLCIKQLFRTGDTNIYADPYSFILIKENLRQYKGQELRLLSGEMFCIGQIISGLDILDKLTGKDTILDIVDGMPISVSTEKYAKLGTSEIDNFADVLKTE